MLCVEGLSAGYGTKLLWSDITFSIKPGEICVLMGENGCGKTTLLRTLQGTGKPKSGKIFWEEQGTVLDLASVAVRKRAGILTTMPQEIPQVTGLSVWDFLEMGLYHKRGPFAKFTKDDIQNIQMLACEYGIEQLLSAFFDELSTGQRQILSLVRTIVQDTPLILLDEPASALDFAHVEILLRMLQRTAAMGKSMLMVLHDPTLAIRVCSRLFCMANGKLYADIENPKDHLMETEMVLRRLYRGLRIHEKPLFCYCENDKIDV